MPQPTALSATLVSASSRSARSNLLLTLLASIAVLLFVCWVELNPKTLGPLTVEDGPLEWTSALLYLISAIGFLVAAKRSEFLRSRGSPWAYFMIVAWAGLAFVCFGEEISWGQRILGFQSPDSLAEVNAQGEFNLHNMYAFADVGGTYRYLSILTIFTGFLFPVMALTNRGSALFRRFCFPVAPLALMPAFIGAYLFGRYYLDISIVQDIRPANAINEVRELLIGYAMALFGCVGAIAPQVLFRSK